MKAMISFVVLLAVAFCVGAHRSAVKSSDLYIRDRVVKLTGGGIQCTGIVIEAPSHKSYILTAAHCRPMVKSGKITAITEDGEVNIVDFIAEDPASDLMLLGGIQDLDGIEVGEFEYNYQPVHTLTHGAGKPTYRTDGMLLEAAQSQVAVYRISSDDERKACQSQFKLEIMDSFWGEMCIMSTVQYSSTADIVPGSSGGPVLNNNGDLVGIVSAYDGKFSYFVTLRDIRSFLYNK